MNNLKLAKQALEYYRNGEWSNVWDETRDGARDVIIVHSLMHIAQTLDDILDIIRQGMHLEQNVGVIEKDARVVGMKIDRIG